MSQNAENKIKSKKHHIKDAPWDENAWKVVGYEELSEEKKEKSKKDMIAAMKQFGVSSDIIEKVENADKSVQNPEN